MQKILVMFITLYLQVGCSSLSFDHPIEREEFSCSQEAEPKSLQFLEQQYRCTRQN